MQGTTICGHLLQLQSAYITPVDAELIPTGAFQDTASAGLDFQEAKPLSEVLQVLPEGIDHNFVLHKEEPDLRGMATDPGMYLVYFVWAAHGTMRSSGSHT
jgi:galactose mutarotase-like enzyme